VGSGDDSSVAAVTRRSYLLVALVYAVLCVALWPWPLLGLLHVESSAVVAGVGFFASGWAALALFRRGATLGAATVRLVALLAVPLGLLTLSLLWRPNCGFFQGLGLYVLFTVPSVVLAVALAWALDAAGWKRRRLWFGLVGLAAALLPVGWDLGLHPQLYTYNHVWGGVLGPIYDEELAVRPGLFWFRGLTLLWALALVVLGDWMRGRRRGWTWLAVGMGIVGVYAATPVLGFNTREAALRDALGSHIATDRFDVYYDSSAVSEGDLRVIADEAAYRYERLREELGVDVSGRIAVYLYPDARAKAMLTGAGETSVAPVWVSRPRMHLTVGRFEDSFAHELAHVFAREFGMPVLRASPAVGLVEGLAVALEPPDGRPSPGAQVAAAVRAQATAELYARGLAEDLVARLSPFGFWTGRGAVSYTTMGAFVRHLLDEHGPERLRTAYRTGDFERAYGIALDSLAVGWQRAVLALPPDPEAEALVARRFTRPSLFEARCPHWVAPWKRAFRAGADALEAGDGEEAYRRFAEAARLGPAEPAALAAWGRLALSHGETDAVIDTLEAALAVVDSLAASPVLARLRDAHALAGHADRADTLLAEALAAYPAYEREARAVLRLRAALAPEALRVLLGPERPAVRAERLARFGTPPAYVLAGLLWAEADDFARAVRALERASGRVPAEVEPVWLGWLARAAHAAGDRVSAAVFAEQAARRFEERGEAAAALRMEDYAALLRSLAPTA